MSQCLSTKARQVQNRNGLVVDTETTQAIGTAEREAAEAMVAMCRDADRLRSGQTRPST
jgi:hypothetical protein